MINYPLMNISIKDWTAINTETSIFYDMDDELFAFYSLENIEIAEDEHKNKLFVFADYCMNSWAYAVRANADGSYEIGALPTENTFQVITSSLDEFILFYLGDTEEMYP